ncbi:ribosomal-processing cysteine protease Prp [Alkalibaculum bacchi]|uniref:ribosomal-processing cysteine protease Prp n=1 Tax=Alkalibaculum bacchi TaxID=645887 RepID=UPI0026EE8050|nr:ribosomal-processing cysteine protease Prp [Alkalibaculum bacchi]
MISCKINRKDGRISSVNIAGHSGYDIIGYDIVCAAVSALSITVLNGLTEYVKADIKYEIKDDGYIDFEILDTDDKIKALQIDAIVETFYLGLKSIELNYSEYIKVQE